MPISKPSVPGAVRRTVADTDALRRLVVRGFQVGDRLRRSRVRVRMLVNSFPKAGTHLLTRALDLSQLVHYSWQHFAPEDFADQSEDSQQRSRLAFAEFLSRLRPGRYATAHVSYHPSLVLTLSQTPVVTLFMVRDPRAMLVSQVRYVMSRRSHFLHQRFSLLYRSDEERLRALLHGFPGSDEWGRGLSSLSDRLSTYADWLRVPDVQLIRFEELAGPRAGGTRQAQIQALASLYSLIPTANATELAISCADKLWSSQSVTFRSGQIDEWRNALSSSFVAEAESSLAPVASVLGYDFNPNR